MKVAVFLDVFPGLSETFVLHHLTGLIEAGHDVVIFARPATNVPKTHEDVARFSLSERMRSLPCQERGAGQLKALPRAILRNLMMGAGLKCLNVVKYGVGVFRLRAVHAYEVVRREQFDLIHCHYASIGWAFTPYRDLFRVPMVVSFHGDHYGSFGRSGRWWLNRLFKVGDAFIANSEFTKGELLNLGCPPFKISVIPAIVEDRGVVTREFGPHSRVPRLLTVARLHESKGIQVALQAIHRLKATGMRVSYTIAGDGPYRLQLERIVTELGLGEVVTFTGWVTQDEAYGQYRHADLFLLPSVGTSDGTNEGQGLVIQEAQLHGLPVVGSALGGVPESLDEGRAGFLVPPGDPDALAAGVRWVLSDPNEAAARARHGALYAKGKYTKRAVIPRLLGLYARLCGAETANALGDLASSTAPSVSVT